MKRPPRFGGWPGIGLSLQMLGCILLGIGLARQFFAIDVIPVQWRFPHYAPVFILLGILLVAPASVLPGRPDV